MAVDITALYCCLDDFCKVFADWEAVSLRRGPPSVKGGDERRFDPRKHRGEGKCPQTQLWAQTSSGGTDRGRSL
jgi:hypothetical protein